MDRQGEGDLRDGMPFLGGRRWIDLVNSKTEALGDFLATPEGWLRWTRAAALGPVDTSADPAAQMAELDAARDFRTQLAGLFEALRTGEPPKSEALHAVNLQLAAVSRRTQLELQDGQLRANEIMVGRATAVTALAADFADFAGSFEAERLRHCSNPECSLVFYDTARNATRRWCSMALCGNRHKVRSHRARRSGPAAE